MTRQKTLPCRLKIELPDTGELFSNADDTDKVL